MSFSSYDPNKDRIIYALIADGVIVKLYADEALAWVHHDRLVKLAKPGSRVSPPQAVRFVDNQTIDSKGFNRVRTGEF